jgi:hypothetical protein
LRVCRAAYDAISFMVPAAGVALTGGNPGLGTAGGSRRFGELTVTFRGNYASTALPRTAYDGGTDTVALARRLPMALPRVDLRLGLIRRDLPVASASADLLASVIPVPKSAIDDVRFGPEVRAVGGMALGFGYGLRIAVEPKPPLPTVSLNVARSGLPAFTFGDLSRGSTYAFTLAVSSISGRLLVGKRFGGIELTGGGGVDLLTGRYSLTYLDPADRSVLPRADSTHTTMRLVTMTNAAIVLGAARLTLEAGFQVGKDDKLVTVFQANDTRAGRFFGGLGLGFRL